MQETIQLYEQFRSKIKAYQYALWVISWDSLTEAPDGSFAYRAKQTGILSQEYYKLTTSPEYVSVVDALFNAKDSLDEVLAHEIIETKKSMDKTRKIPMDEYVAFRKLMATSEATWAKAKQTNDFAAFAPVLEEILGFMRKYVSYLETDELKGYNVLLDEYESGFTTKEYDAFFDLLKERLVPFVRKITALQQQPKTAFSQAFYPKADQITFAKYLQKVLQYDTDRGLMKESEHPCTSGHSRSDVRWTNHYHENMVLSGIFSAIHELGHALYEQQCDPALEDTFSDGGASMAMHESQSRFFENMIGRSKAFWEVHLPELKKLFPEQLQDVSVEQFYREINRVENSLIRTEADELTYPLHVMLRYDIEKQLLAGELEVKDLPSVWNAKIHEYFGIDVPNDSKGVLQDVHWSGGMFGYFPTYALGSAYSAQIAQAMNKSFHVLGSLSSGSTKEINAWLQEHIHRFGSTKYPKELMLIATKEEFSAQYYIDYLINKYSEIYNLA